MNPRKIGIYSGSFNPVHIGHIALADYLVGQRLVDEVWLVRSPLNPLKQSSDLMPDDDRLQMLELATIGHPGLRVSTIEDELPLPNYTITTFRTLQRRFPNDEFHLIVGADNWLIFDRWKDYDQLLRDFHLIVYPRPGYPFSPSESLLPVDHVRFVEAPLYDISSTQIRQRLAEQLPLDGLVCPAVANYLKNHFTPHI